MRLLARLEDHRLLPFFVVVSMALGILIGKALGISNYELTPPIDAIKSIFQGTYAFTIGNTLALGVVVGLFLMMYPAMTNVRVDELGHAFRSPRALLLVAFFNERRRLLHDIVLGTVVINNAQRAAELRSVLGAARAG
ncbi:MAG: hypothetical protein AAB303_03830 [Chloroflexota bacterium]